MGAGATKAGNVGKDALYQHEYGYGRQKRGEKARGGTEAFSVVFGTSARLGGRLWQAFGHHEQPGACQGADRPLNGHGRTRSCDERRVVEVRQQKARRDGGRYLGPSAKDRPECERLQQAEGASLKDRRHDA